MSGGSPAGPDVLEVVERRFERRGTWFGEDNVVRRLTVADYVSLVALLFGWTCVVLFALGEPYWAVLAMLVGYGFDKLDGYVARRLGVSSPFGRQVDSYIDVFVYLVPAALAYHYTLSPHPLATVVVGFAVLAFGGLRLVRHNDEGFLENEAGESCYHGTTVVHTNVVVVACSLVAAVLALPTLWGWLAGALVVAVCPLMVSEYRAPKTDTAHAVGGVVVLVVAATALALEYGVL
jgi:CDP-diacylglycerol--serine O-phosphatidyltransferase